MAALRLYEMEMVERENGRESRINEPLLEIASDTTGERMDVDDILPFIEDLNCGEFDC